MAQYSEYFIYLEYALFWYLVIISNTVVFCRKQKALWVILLLTGNTQRVRLNMNNDSIAFHSENIPQTNSTISNYFNNVSCLKKQFSLPACLLILYLTHLLVDLLFLLYLCKF